MHLNKIRFYLVLLITCFSVGFCWAEEPQAIWLTWLEDPTSSMVICWMEEAKKEQEPEIGVEEKRTLSYREESLDAEWQFEEAMLVPLPEECGFLVGKIELIGLRPDTMYEFRFGGEEQSYRFKTAPEQLNQPLKFVVGGDTMQHEVGLFQETCELAAKQQPTFAVLGGDLAYAAPSSKSKLEEFKRWQSWLTIWFKTMRIGKDQLIPLLVAIGNHEVKGGFGQSTKQAPFFYALFPRETAKGYAAIRFDEYLSLYLLDTGHTQSVNGEQSAWLEKQLKKDAKSIHKIAVYHVPAYPSVRYFKNDTSTKIRKCWIPLFDKYGVHFAFENHDHAYKRTFPLQDNAIHPKGVVYIGDGAWGAKPRIPKRASSSTFLAKSAALRHFCLVTLSEEERTMSAISGEGVIFDKLVQLSDHKIVASDSKRGNETVGSDASR